ncbi:MAG: Tfp pilus assembly protein FimT/FimU [Bacillota bacterium]|jgi:prepilin-type N-terminal cleavage/methylation domain-containing protein
MSRRAGFTLIEMLTVVVLIGAVVLMSWPLMRSAKYKSELRSARTSVASMYARARSAAVQYNRATILAFNGASAVVLATPRLQAGGTVDTVGRVNNLGVGYGVTVASTNDSLRVDPRGFGGNSGTVTVRLRKAEFTDSVVISGYGRLVQ